jgi:hypothetical protein
MRNASGIQAGKSFSAIERDIRSKLHDLRVAIQMFPIGWLSSKEREEAVAIVENNTVVSGGCISSMLLGEPVKDYDIYFSSYHSALFMAKLFTKIFLLQEDMAERRARVEEYKHVNIRGEEESRIRIFIKRVGVLEADDPQEVSEPSISGKSEELYRPIFLSQNAVTLSGDIQLVFRFWGEPSKIHSTYDYAHAMCYYTNGEGLVTPLQALESILTRRLVYCGSLYPICSLFRLRKFMKRGWSISAGELLKLASNITRVDLEIIDTLTDQLQGVDTTYMMSLIRELRTGVNDYKSNNPSHSDKEYREWAITMISELVDRVWNGVEEEE